MLGLLHEPKAIAARVMVGLDAPLASVRRAATATLAPPSDATPDAVGFGPGARKALELTLRAALRLGHDDIGTEHVLLALLEQEDGTGPLADVGLAKAAVETAVRAALAQLDGP